MPATRAMKACAHCSASGLGAGIRKAWRACVSLAVPAAVLKMSVSALEMAVQQPLDQQWTLRWKSDFRLKP